MASKDDILKGPISGGLNISLGRDGLWKLYSDQYNYILAKRVGRKADKNGNPRYAVQGYFRDVEGVLNAIVESNIKGLQVSSITALNREIKSIRKEIKSYVELMKNDAN